VAAEDGRDEVGAAAVAAAAARGRARRGFRLVFF
jgi:hypothetical protein